MMCQLTEPLVKDAFISDTAAQECTSRITYTHNLGSMIPIHRGLLSQGTLPFIVVYVLSLSSVSLPGLEVSPG